MCTHSLHIESTCLHRLSDHVHALSERGGGRKRGGGGRRSREEGMSTTQMWGVCVGEGVVCGGIKKGE